MFQISDELKAAERAALDAMQAAVNRLKRVSNPASVDAARAQWVAASTALEVVRAEIREAELTHLRTLSDEDLLKRLASAANYSYEANMSDYSMGSINRAAYDLENVTAVVTERGFDHKTAIRWAVEMRFPRWVPASLSDLIAGKITALRAQKQAIDEAIYDLVVEREIAQNAERDAVVSA